MYSSFLQSNGYRSTMNLINETHNLYEKKKKLIIYL